MIIEQIRYYTAEDAVDQILEARREVSNLRRQLNLPPGRILIADPAPEGTPAVVWQCAYEDEGLMGSAEAAVMGHADYEAARGRLATLAVRVEVELFMTDDEEDGPDEV